MGYNWIKKGHFVIKPQFDNAYSFSEVLARVTNSGEYVIIRL